MYIFVNFEVCYMLRKIRVFIMGKQIPISVQYLLEQVA
jgi:hypothetical protein